MNKKNINIKESINFYKKGMYSFENIINILFNEINKYNYYNFNNNYKLKLINKINKINLKERKIKQELIIKRLENILNACIKIENYNIIEEANIYLKTTPYAILSIEHKEYSKEELLYILGNKIESVKKSGVRKDLKKIIIERLLDAYNEINNIMEKKLK